ncbi:hypothetical protein NL351_28735, partial [Klebsiella pneumoniae]|nr:hypothetical protein [Klebsiella pneumoniae]
TFIGTIISNIQQAWANFTSGFAQGLDPSTLQNLQTAFQLLGVYVEQVGKAIGQFVQALSPLAELFATSSEGANYFGNAGRFLGQVVT